MPLCSLDHPFPLRYIPSSNSRLTTSGSPTPTPAEEIAEDGIDDETGQEISATKSDQYKDLPTAAPHESKQHQQATQSNGKL